MAFNNIYKGKKVLVTGHTGFKGSWLSMWLKELGAEVYGVALVSRTLDDNFEATGLENRIGHFLLDIKIKEDLFDIFSLVQPDIVFHLAAQALVKSSYDDPVDTFETNLIGTLNVMEAIRKTPSVKTGIMITSDKCYKNVEWEWGYRETDEMGGLDPYGASKSCAELAIQSYRESFFKAPGAAKIASVRAGNVIGGGDWSEKRIVPDIIRALIEKQPIELRNPKATRPWQFVLEPLSGYLWLGAKMLQEGDLTNGWNFGPEPSTIVPVGTLTEKVIKLWGSGTINDISDKTQFHEATLLSLDISKARHRLHWRPTLTLNETIKFTVQWYQKRAEKEDMHEFGVKQIKDYMKKAKKRDIQWAQ
ncbi:MAG: CDP-glucose 4,6-dehydratase [bacterium]|nr:CDP-glucose 4,6-dehydratase [bacterium]